MRTLAAATVGAAFCASASGAAETAGCRLALVLALDISASVDAREYLLQRDGVAAALADQQVRETILALGGVQLAAFEWSGRDQQALIMNWTPLDSEAAVLAASERIGSHRRTSSDYPTALGSALAYAAGQLDRAPPCERQVVDVSGDGENNHGFEPQEAFASFDFSDVTVNGLVVAGAGRDVVGYFEEHVLHGPGAFLEVAEGYEDYAAAMRRKLLRELTPPSVAEAR